MSASNARRAALCLALAAVACSGGAGGSDAPSVLRGLLRSEPFDPVEITFAGPRSAEACTSPRVPASFGNTAALLAFSAAPGACALATAPCDGKRDLTFVAGAVTHAHVSGVALPLEPGTYHVVSAAADAPIDPFTGEVRVAKLVAQHTSATTCALDAEPPEAEGTLLLEAVSGTELRGTIDVRFHDAGGAEVGTLNGPFAARPCALEFEACHPAPATCSGALTCL